MIGNVDRFSGFAPDYDLYRPSPPFVLKEILGRLARAEKPAFVVDLGSGTGLSARFWADCADRVAGVEPNQDMRAYAISVTTERNVEYADRTSSDTGLREGVADIITCSQSLHWMEPDPTFREVARVLRTGGVFAAYDCDWPPTTGVWEADLAYSECMRTVAEFAKKADIPDGVKAWDKHCHLDRMRKSGVFRFAKEIVVHQEDKGDASRFVGLLMSQGSVRSLLRSGYDESDLRIDAFKRLCEACLGEVARTWYWSYRVRIGIK